LVLLCSSAPARAQGKSDAFFLTEAIVRVTNLAKSAENIGAYGYNDGVSIVAGWVKHKGSLTLNTPLTAGTTYMFLAGGDKDATDVDLEIFDPNGKKVAWDTTAFPEAIVTYTPTVSGTYPMKLTLFDSRERTSGKNVSCVCAAVILKKSGWKVAFANLDNATDNLSKLLSNVDQNVARKLGKRLYLNNASGQWAVYGGVLKKGFEMSVNTMNVGSGDRLFAGVSDGTATNMDLFYLNSKGQKVKGPDPKSPLPTPYILHTPTDANHGLRIVNRDTTTGGAALVMMAVMDFDN
jgi:hypothetical protein